MDLNGGKNLVDLFKWFINTVVIVLLTFFLTWVLDERKQGIEEIKIYNTYVELITKVDGLAERRLLAEFFSNVSVSPKLKEGWVDYYNILNRQYLEELNRQDSIINQINKFNNERNSELEYAISIKNKIEKVGLVSPIIKEDKEIDIESALKYELEGFNFLLDRNIKDAILSFSFSEKSYNSFHQVYEIGNYLSKKNKSGILMDDDFWNSLYLDLLKDYSWKMPASIKTELEKITNK